LEALGINLGYLLAFALSFGILFVVLRAWVYKPLLNMLEKRRITIAKGLEDARVAADARANAEKEANRIITEAQTHSADIVREATDRAGKVEHEIRAQAETEMARARELARAELDVERNRMLSELRGQIVALAMSASRKLVSESLDENRQRQLVKEFFSGISDGSVKLFENASLHAGEDVEVISALPLTEEEQAVIRRDLAARSGSTQAASVYFRVDPSILGGLIIHAGDRVVDGSVAGQLGDLQQSLR
jgi:F-type H+-transporting ATPase subunit b